MRTPNQSKSAVSSILVIGAGCAIAIIIFGPRSTLGLFVEPVTSARGWGRDVFALAMAIQQLVWGAAQPIGGAIADRFGAWKAVTGGAVLYAAGMVMMSFATTTGELYFTAGILIGAGLAGGGLPVVVAAVGKCVSPERRSLALGIVTAGSSLGQFTFAPLGLWFIGEFGWVIALSLLAVPLLTLPIIALPFRHSSGSNSIAARNTESFSQSLSRACKHRSYVLLNCGFFVCGFHVSFITVHLPPYFIDLGIEASEAALALSLIGLFNVLGAVLAGFLGHRYSKRYLLSLLYLARGIVIAIFLISDKSFSAVVLFSAALGLLWLSTVPLTSGLVAVMFGTERLGTLFGVVFFSHQIGAFIGIWLGGYLYETQGSYQSTWAIAVGLSLLAALLHLPIEERNALAEPMPAA